MQEKKTTSSRKRTTSASENGIVGKEVTTGDNRIKALLTQGTTWAGIFTIAQAVSSGGVSLLADPNFWTQVGVGAALILAKERTK